MEKNNEILVLNVSKKLDAFSLRRAFYDSLTLLRILQRKVQVILPANLDFVDFYHAYQGDQELPIGDVHFILAGEEGYFEYKIEKAVLTERLIIQAPLFQRFGNLIEDYCDGFQKKYGAYGYLRSYDEYRQNNERTLAKRSFNSQEELLRLPKLKDDLGNIFIDCQHLPGFDHYFQGLLFTACWIMYYSKEYFQLFPRELFAGVQQVEKVTEFAASPQQTIKTRLFNDPTNWEHPANLKFQQLYRDQLAIHQLSTTNGIGILQEPMVEYNFTEDFLQCIQYFNENQQPTYKSQARFFITRTIDRKTAENKTTVTRGTLNARAYFPWLNEQKNQMMNYRIIDPRYTLDNGVSAYEYYIRHFLEIKINDESYQNFETILVFYLPPQALDNLPLVELQARFRDVEVHVVKALLKHRPAPTFDLKKGDNHLRVVFADYSYLTLPQRPLFS